MGKGRGGNMKSNWNKVSKYRNELFGVAAILVLLVHSIDYDWPEKVRIVQEIFKQGSIGVDIFLFLAGVGLYYSLKKDSDIKNFMIRRIKRVLIPSLIIVIPGYILLDLIVNNIGVSRFFLDIFFLRFWIYGGDGTWYVSFTIILYLIYPAIYFFVLKRRSRFKFYTIFLLVLVLNVWLCLSVLEFYSKYESSFARLPIFLLGCWAGEWVYGKKQYTIGLPIGLLVIYTVIRATLIYSRSMIPYEMYTLIFRGSYVFGALAIVLLVPTILERLHLSRIDRILSCIGGLSLEIYLIHIFLSNIFRSSSIGKRYNSVWIYFIFIIPLSLLLVKAYEEIKKRISE